MTAHATSAPPTSPATSWPASLALRGPFFSKRSGTRSANSTSKCETPVPPEQHGRLAGVTAQSAAIFRRKNAMTKLRSTSDSISARPRIIGVWIFAVAPGLREMPSSAAAAARP